MAKPTNFNITEHFHLGEFAQPRKRGFPAETYPHWNEGWLKERLVPLCESLEVIREAIGQNLYILSGYRTKAYNKAVGGALHSQHCEGRAADIFAFDMPAPKLQEVITQLMKDGKLPKVRGFGRYPKFSHIDVRPSLHVVIWKGKK